MSTETTPDTMKLSERARLREKKCRAMLTKYPNMAPEIKAGFQKTIDETPKLVLMHRLVEDAERKRQMKADQAE